MKFWIAILLMLLPLVSHSQEELADITISQNETYQISGIGVTNIFFSIDRVLGWKREGSEIIFFPISSYGETTAMIIRDNGEIDHKSFVLGRERNRSLNKLGTTVNARIGGSYFFDQNQQSRRSYFADLNLNLKKEEKVFGIIRYTESEYQSEIQSYYVGYLNGNHTIGYGSIYGSNVVNGFQGSSLLGLEYRYRPKDARFLHIYSGDEFYQERYKENGLTYTHLINPNVQLGYSLTQAAGTRSDDSHITNGVSLNAYRIFDHFNYGLGVSNRENLYLIYNSLTYISQSSNPTYRLRDITMSAFNAPGGAYGSYYSNLGSKNEYNLSLALSNQLQRQILQNEFERIDGLLSTSFNYRLVNDDFLIQNSLLMSNHYNFSKINTSFNASMAWNSDDLPSYQRYTISPEIGVIFSGDRVKGWGVSNRNVFELNKTEDYRQSQETNYLALNRYYFGLSGSVFVGQGSSQTEQGNSNSNLVGGTVNYYKNKYGIAGSYQSQRSQTSESNRAQIIFSRRDNDLTLAARFNYSSNENSLDSSDYLTAYLNAIYSFSVGEGYVRDRINKVPSVITAQFFMDKNYNSVQEQGEPYYEGPLDVDMGRANKSYDLKSGLLVVKDTEDRPYFFELPSGLVSSSRYVNPGKIDQKVGIYPAKNKKIQILENGEVNNGYTLKAICGSYEFNSFEVEGNFINFKQPIDLTCEFEINLDYVSVPVMISNTTTSDELTIINVERIQPVVFVEIEGKTPKSMIIEENKVLNPEASFKYELKNYKNGSFEVKVPGCSIMGLSIIPYKLVNPTYFLRIRCN